MTGELGTVLMFHRIAPYHPNAIVHNENLKISPEDLERVIQEFRRMGHVFISLDELNRILKYGEKPKRKFVVVTLDDGYKDNLEYALPIFRKHNVPFCVYVTNCFPNRTTTLWWYALEHTIFQNRLLSMLDGSTLLNDNAKQKNRNFLHIRNEIITRHFVDPLKYLNQIGELNFILEKEISEKCMTWEDIQQLAEEELVTIGCHTVNHYPLSRLSADQVREEIRLSKAELEQKLSRPMKHFAFPFGGRREAGARDYALADEYGFDTIATTWQDHIYRKSNPKQLERLFIFPLENNGYTLNKLLYRNRAIYISKARKFIRRILR
jgi:peptidoglycan/xylan/chitin deacetylase (PgdA/CDA1 family)